MNRKNGANETLEDSNTLYYNGQSYDKRKLPSRLVELFEKYQHYAETGDALIGEYDWSVYRDHRDIVKSGVSQTIHATLSRASGASNLDIIPTPEPVICDSDIDECP